jgi:nucleotide-binding universal stress UspA family protein
VHVLIATTGALSPEPVAKLSGLIAGPAGTVSVITVIEVPRSFLDTIRSEEWHPLGDDQPPWGTHEDAVIARYVEERGRRITEPILAALRAAGMDAEVHYLEGEDPAQVIVDAADALEADLIILGATKPIFDESSWESVSVRVMQDNRRPVLIIPATPRLVDEDEELVDIPDSAPES